MNPHLFLFHPGVWIGEGKITFTGSIDTVKFFTRWSLQEASDHFRVYLQEVELHGLDQTTKNVLTLRDITPERFHITLENDLMGKVSGKGVIEEKLIAWELRDHPGLEGMEVYELMDNGEYHFRSQYISSEQHKSIIEGKIWKKE